MSARAGKLGAHAWLYLLAALCLVGDSRAAAQESVPLIVRVVGRPEPYVITAQSAEGGFDDTAQAVAREAFGGWNGGPNVHPRLLELIHRAMRHFDAPYVQLISGLRNDRKASRHSHGMAADIVLPGVRDTTLAAFFRGQGFTGVGTYPRSGFVHVDVREASYFWIDRSPPGRRRRERQVRQDEARAADQAALARGDRPTLNPAALQSALEQRAVARQARGKRRPTGVRRSRVRAARAHRDGNTRASSVTRTERVRSNRRRVRD